MNKKKKEKLITNLIGTSITVIMFLVIMGIPILIIIKSSNNSNSFNEKYSPCFDEVAIKYCEENNYTFSHNGLKDFYLNVCKDMDDCDRFNEIWFYCRIGKQRTGQDMAKFFFLEKEVNTCFSQNQRKAK